MERTYCKNCKNDTPTLGYTENKGKDVFYVAYCADCCAERSRTVVSSVEARYGVRNIRSAWSASSVLGHKDTDNADEKGG